MREPTEVWKIRCTKNYPEESNHLIVGNVLSDTPWNIRLLCKTYHFGHNVTSPNDISKGGYGIRIVPWNNVEIINVLPNDFDVLGAKLVTYEKGLMLIDPKGNHCVIHRRKNRY